MNGTSPAPQYSQVPPNNYPGTPPPPDVHYQQFQNPQMQTQYPPDASQQQYQNQQAMQYQQQPIYNGMPSLQGEHQMHYIAPQPEITSAPNSSQGYQHLPTSPELKPMPSATARPTSNGVPSSMSVTPQQEYHAKHWTPPTGPPRHWDSGMCDCLDDMKICCIGLWCPCILYSRTYHRLRSDPSTLKDGYSYCNIVSFLHYCCGGGATSSRQRSEIRYRYNLPGSECGDLWRHCCCGPCSLCQEEREVRGREKAHRAIYLQQQEQQQQGYEKNPGMVYGK